MMLSDSSRESDHLNHQSVDMDGKNSHPARGTNKRWIIAVVFLSVACCLLLLSLIIVVSVNKDEENDMKTCKGVSSSERIDLREPENPSVFHDLTTKEVKGIMDFIYADRELNLVLPRDARINASYMFSVDLYLPDKDEVLNYLDSSSNAQKPTRAAVVTLFRGDKNPKVNEEYKIYPLPKPNRKTLHRTVPFNYRPLTGPEFGKSLQLLAEECNKKARDLLYESFGGYTMNCGDKCLVFKMFSTMGSATTGDSVRKIWYWMSQSVEFYISHPVDFTILVASIGSDVVIEKVWYNGRSFDSLDELVQNYTSGNIPKMTVEFPSASKELFSKLHLRGTVFPKSNLRPPIQVEPDGKRYSVVGQEVRYMNWNFHFRMSNTHGPQLYNILYQNERIIYELALQELIAFYSDSEPTHMFANYFDSVGMIGQQIKGLVPGVDCPTHATFMDTSLVTEGSTVPAKYKNAFCIFEQSTGDPLRRHHSYSQFQGSFYEGVQNYVLVLRTVATVINYDYIFDFIFFQSGAIEVKITPTGYILPTYHTAWRGQKYGFKLQDEILGNIHHHSFNFKVDLDIKGKSNRYETLEIKNERIPNPFSKATNAQWDQEKLVRNVHPNEKSGAFKFDFDFPKYHIFYNDAVKDKYGNQKAYRIVSKGMSKSILPEGSGNEPSGAWMRYQMAVTKRKESERQSSSMYAIFDSSNPTVNFQDFIDDNESIKDEDIVTWVTMGTHHIPHTEDLPVTHTPGVDLSFYILPFNYFPEDPSMGSRDAIRIELKDSRNPSAGIKIDRYTNTDDTKCVPEENKYFKTIQEEPSTILDTGEGGGSVV